MKHLLFLSCLVWIGASATPIDAQESTENELELIRQLRNKGWNDFAKLKIEDLLKRNDPALNAALPLELARVNIAIARQQDAEQRFALFTDARKQLQDFIGKNAGKPQAALASAELARVTSYHAQALLTKAMREEDNKSKHERARPAEAMFVEAGKDLEKAIKAIDAALADPSAASFKTRLQAERSEARFDVAVNLFNQGRTYIDKSKVKVNTDRAEAIKKAKTAFEALRSDESLEIGWLANAWLMKIAMEQTDPDVVKKYYDLVMKRKDDKSAQAAVRLIRYFHMQDVTIQREDTETIGGYALADKKSKASALDRLRTVQKEGEAWLKSYPSYLKTYEGQGVLFELGYAFYADANNDKDQKGTAVNNRYDKAVKYFDELAALDGDLSERARQYSMEIKYKRTDAKTVFRTFDEYWMKAMIERKKVVELSQKLEDPKLGDARAKTEEERRQHLKDVVHALQRSLAAATSKTPVQKVGDARFYLSGAYLASGDPHRAAVVAESLGRTKPPTRRSPDAAATAVATYSALLNRTPDDAAVRQRLQDMIDFVLAPDTQRLWAADPVTSMAHYHLAMLAKRDNDPKNAIANLAKLAPDFTDYIYTQGQLVFIAEAAREKTEVKKDQQFYIAAAKAALTRMPKLNAKSESSSVIAMYFFAKMEWPKYTYMEAKQELEAREELKAVKKFNEIKTYVKSLMSEFEPVLPHPGGNDNIPDGRLSSANHEQLLFSMNVMLKFADLGIAEVKFRSDSKDRFEEVLKATDAVVKDTLKRAQSVKSGPVRMKDYRVTGDILGLALRAHVQQGSADKGKEILDVLKRITSEDGTTSGNVVGAVLNDIAGQIRRMKTDNDPALKQTNSHYSAFLDEIAKEYDAKGYDPAAAMMMARAFASLEYHDKAVKVFSKVPPPANLDKKIDRQPNETPQQQEARQKWEEETNRHWGMQIEYIRALRAVKDTDSLKTADSLINAMLKHPFANYKVQALMEKNLLFEDREKYREAYLAWQSFLKMKSLTDNLGNKDVQNVFFTGYFYSVRSFNKIAVHDKAIKDPPKMVLGAANMLIKLEYARTKDGWNIVEPLVTEYLKEKEAEGLKKEYDRLKAAQENALRSKTSIDPTRPREQAIIGGINNARRAFPTNFEPQRHEGTEKKPGANGI
jgi:hypothetical protein